MRNPLFSAASLLAKPKPIMSEQVATILIPKGSQGGHQLYEFANTLPKHGNEGKWKTPHQQTKGSTPQSNGVVAPGDVGVWVTCARNQEWKAAREVTDLFGEVIRQPPCGRQSGGIRS